MQPTSVTPVHKHACHNSVPFTELVALELMVNSVTMAFALISMVAGIFGMNLATGWESSQVAFWTVCAISCVMGFFVCGSVIVYARAKRLLFISSMLEQRPGP